MKNNDSIKKKIVNQAKSFLKSKGTFTIKEIADSCFINIAAVNYHFGSKENLLNIVLQEIIEELKSLLKVTINQLPNDANNEEVMEIILTMTYDFAIENVGIINYLFLQNEYQNENVHILIKEFFIDSPFTQEIYQKISDVTNSNDPETIRVKYLLLFSSFAIPLFIQIISNKNQDDFMSLKRPSFRKKFIKELLKILVDEKK
jgi:AcrR family transcriptional regulator